MRADEELRDFIKRCDRGGKTDALNDEGATESLFVIWSFVILSTLVIRHSSFCARSAFSRSRLTLKCTPRLFSASA